MVEIVESTPRRLVLQKSGRTMRAFLLGGVGLLLVGCLMASTTRTTSVRCARGPAGLTCDATEKLFGLIPLDRRQVDHVRKAVVDTTGDSSDPSYRVELATESGFSNEPLSSITVDEMQATSFVRRFNEFLDRGPPADAFLQLPGWELLVLLPFPFLAALACFLLAQPYRLEIDRELARLTIRDGITRRASHPLADVDDVRVEEREHEGHTLREVFLLLKGGTRLRLDIEPAQVDLVGDYVPRRAS